MPHHPIIAVTGRITHVFAHRFVVETKRGAVLADVTPHGLDLVTLRKGTAVSLEGEMKPSELKVHRFASGRKTVTIEHHKPHHHHGPHHHHHHEPADPKVARASARAAGYEVMSEPQRHPKHFEVLGRQNRRFTELHIDLDGEIYKWKPVRAGDPKWPEAVSAPARRRPAPRRSTKAVAPRRRTKSRARAAD